MSNTILAQDNQMRNLTHLSAKAINSKKMNLIIIKWISTRLQKLSPVALNECKAFGMR